MGEASLGRAQLCLAVGDAHGAVAALEDAVARMPEFAEGHRLLGGLYLGSLDDCPRARHLRAGVHPALAGAGSLGPAAEVLRSPGDPVPTSAADRWAGSGPPLADW